MSEIFYRFRSIKSLLDEFEELEKQSIYFAKPEELNDPIEGFRDIFWAGDSIVWKNLFKHYLLCLERLCSLQIICGEEHPISVDDIPVFSGEDDYPTPQYKELFVRISDSFFNNTELECFIAQIADRSTPIRRDELFFYFESIHLIALETIFEEYEKSGLVSEKRNKNHKAHELLNNLVKTDFVGVIEKALEEKSHPENVIDVIFSAQKNTQNQMDIIRRYNGIIDSNRKNQNLVSFEFPEEYLKKLEKLIYPDWFTACFMSDCSNSSVWGHYGDNHKGVCLMFTSEIEGEDYHLKLREYNRWGGSRQTNGYKPHKLIPIDYENGYGQIDFFRSLGRLSKHILDTVWFSSKGKISECAENMYKSEEQWRKKYWNNFFRDITVKTEDWEYEKEYRIILSSSLDSYSNKESRIFTYDFQSLAGIVFGIKTSTEDKIKILKIIEKKCEETGRKDFKLFQAYYSNEEKSIKYAELSLIKFEDQV